MFELELNARLPIRDEIAERFMRRTAERFMLMRGTGLVASSEVEEFLAKSAELKGFLAEQSEKLKRLADEDDPDAMYGVRIN